MVVQVGTAAAVTITVVANMSRPDLVKAKVAPDPLHGFSVEVPYHPPLAVTTWSYRCLHQSLLI